MNGYNRRDFLKTAGAGLASLPVIALFEGCARDAIQKRPNVVLIITDDQGYGDLGVHGNEKIRTPNLDHFAGESAGLSQFYACPVCAPTRACLMTGRYNYRTGVVDTYLGRAMMHSDEVTMAEIFKFAGYRTGIFGKWHLGDNYPMRPSEQGFEESLVHNGGGLCQPSDWPDNTYFNPMLKRNNEWKESQGYCTDIFFREAMQYIEMHKDEPFFAYIATNAPHTPLQIADEYVKPYLDMGLDETTAQVYGMVTNIDENFGRLTAKLRELKLEENTIVIFLTDNGPQQERYTAGLRGRKGSVYEGGIRVPFYVRWSGVFEPGRRSDRIAAHIDVLPTLLDACGIDIPEEAALDGRSVLPLLSGDGNAWQDRTLFFQWHRGDEPELFRSSAARNQRYKLVNGNELYDLETDRGEERNIAGEFPAIAAELRAQYEDWFRDVSSTRGYAPPRIYLGTQYENPVTLTRQDWRGAQGWSDDDLGYWEVKVAEEGDYEIQLRFSELRYPATARFKFGGVEKRQTLKRGETSCSFEGVKLPISEGVLEARLEWSGKSVGVMYVDVRKE